MNLKQRKFYEIKELYNTINLNQKSICVFVHVSNLNTIENNLVKIFCEKNSVKNKYVKINLLKKLTKNSLFLNLLTGPTKLFFFSDINVFLNFFENFPLKKKVYPLAVFFNNQFFSYYFFFNHLKNLRLPFNDFDKNFKTIQENFIAHTASSNLVLLSSLNLPLFNFINALTYFKNNNKNI